MSPSSRAKRRRVPQLAHGGCCSSAHCQQRSPVCADPHGSRWPPHWGQGSCSLRRLAQSQQRSRPNSATEKISCRPQSAHGPNCRSRQFGHSPPSRSLDERMRAPPHCRHGPSSRVAQSWHRPPVYALPTTSRSPPQLTQDPNAACQTSCAQAPQIRSSWLETLTNSRRSPQTKHGGNLRSASSASLNLRCHAASFSAIAALKTSAPSAHSSISRRALAKNTRRV